MRYKIRELNGHWMLEVAGKPERSLLLKPEEHAQVMLLVFLGLAKWVRGELVVEEGEFEV